MRALTAIAIFISLTAPNLSHALVSKYIYPNQENEKVGWIIAATSGGLLLPSGGAFAYVLCGVMKDGVTPGRKSALKVTGSFMGFALMASLGGLIVFEDETPDLAFPFRLNSEDPERIALWESFWLEHSPQLKPLTAEALPPMCTDRFVLDSELSGLYY